MRRSWLAAGALVLALQAPAAFAADSVTVTLGAQNGSGETGTATLTAMGDQTQVVLKLDNAPAQGQPAHIHMGSCANLNPAPKYPLANVVAGASTTVVNAKLADLTAGNMAINVHKSAADLQTYVACGDIPTGAVGAASMPSAAPATGGGYGGAGQGAAYGLAGTLVAALAAAGLAGRKRAAR